LPEEQELKKLREEYEELMIKREEQNEVLEVHRDKAGELKVEEAKQDAVTTALNKEIETSNNDI